MPKIENSTETFHTAKSPEEARQKIVSFAGMTRGKVTLNNPDQVVVQYGSAFKFRMFGVLMGEMEEFPRSISIKLSPEAENTRVEVTVQDEIKFGSIRAIKGDIKHLFFRDLYKIKSLLNGG